MSDDSILIPGLGVTVLFVSNPHASRYVLRMASDGTFRCAIPRRGSLREAREFVARNHAWLEKQIERRRAHPPPSTEWPDGHEFLFRGEPARIEFRESDGVVCFADQIVPLRGGTTNFRPVVEWRLRNLAAREFPPRVREIAEQHGLHVARVSVRAQRSRWGSCSHNKTISLNWRLIQSPAFVRDYVIVHELMHLRHMNHSNDFWNAVAQAFPDWKASEAWLKKHSGLLR